jgi:U4/U6.U5 tri-snRNP-associated protein 2
VFIHLHDVRAFCLPDGYEILDASLEDVKKCLAPAFSKDDISRLNRNSSLARDVYGINYLPGFIGLNNLKNTDYVNVVLHALSHVTPVRDFFLQVRTGTDAYVTLCFYFISFCSTFLFLNLYLFILLCSSIYLSI